MKALIALFALVILILAAGLGWVINLISIFTDLATISLVELIVRIVGVPVFPVGALAGWFI